MHISQNKLCCHRQADYARVILKPITWHISLMSTGRTRRLSENGYFPQSLRQAQILILEILNVFLRLKSSPSLTLQKISHSRTAS